MYVCPIISKRERESASNGAQATRTRQSVDLPAALSLMVRLGGMALYGGEGTETCPASSLLPACGGNV